jgi:OOP family OmpA-OmpF porin
MSLCSLARAQDKAPVSMRPYILQTLDYQFADTSRRAQNGRGGLLGAGLPLSRHFNVELSGFYTAFNPNPQAPAYGWHDYGGRFDGMFFYSRNPAFSPYFDFGAGYGRNVLKTGGLADSGPLLDSGFGAIHYFVLGDLSLGVRGDARYRWAFLDDDKFPGTGVRGMLGEPIFSFGLLVPIGSAAKGTPSTPPPR